jgi:oligopeptide/dipeptide ABC transporter ATP-binding protein
VRCIRSEELELAGLAGHARNGASEEVSVAPVTIGSVRTATGAPAADEPEKLLEVRGLTKEYNARGLIFGRDRYLVRAVDNVSFDIRAGETLGVVGETGAGKSTVGRLVLGLERPTGGSISFRGVELGGVDKRPMSVHRDIEVIFQNPYASLNPSMSVLDLVAEPIDVHDHLPKAKRTEAVAELLSSVGLDGAYLRRYVYELSGGQLQRVAIARTLSMNPKLIVLDEPTTALDVSSQAQVVNLLQELQATHGLSYLLIGHNLAVVSHTSDRLAILYAGQVVEVGESEAVYRHPRHPYTQALIGAILSIDPSERRSGGRTSEIRRSEGPTPPGDVVPHVEMSPGAAAVRVPGCVYAPRCAFAQDVCRTDEPPDVECKDGTIVRCHFAAEGVGKAPAAAVAVGKAAR